MFTTSLQIQDALSRTGRRMALDNSDEFALLVCGGSALCLAGLVDRPTRDVDVLGLVKGAKQDLVVAEVLPEEITKAAAAVALDLDLPRDWLNDAALEVQRLGLPAGIVQRAEKRGFGPCLTVYLLSRQDQVALKLYAAIDPVNGERHFKDVMALKPSKEDMEVAVHWLFDRETSSQFRAAVARICKAIGFPKLASLAAANDDTTRTAPTGRNRKKPRREPS